MAVFARMVLAVPNAVSHSPLMVLEFWGLYIHLAKGET